MITIEKILHDNFGGLEDAMGGDKDLAHFYRSLIGVCMQQYAIEALDYSLVDNVDIEDVYDTVEGEEW